MPCLSRCAPFSRARNQSSAKEAPAAFNPFDVIDEALGSQRQPPQGAGTRVRFRVPRAELTRLASPRSQTPRATRPTPSTTSPKTCSPSSRSKCLRRQRRALGSLCPTPARDAPLRRALRRTRRRHSAIDRKARRARRARTRITRQAATRARHAVLAAMTRARLRARSCDSTRCARSRLCTRDDLPSPSLPRRPTRAGARGALCRRLTRRRRRPSPWAWRRFRRHIRPRCRGTSARRRTQEGRWRRKRRPRSRRPCPPRPRRWRLKWTRCR